MRFTGPGLTSYHHLRRSATKQIKSLTEKYRKAKSSKEEAKFSEDLNLIVERTAVIAKKVKNDLVEQSKANESKANMQHNEQRIRKQMHQTITKKYIEVVKEYQTSQSDFQAQLKSAVGRRLRIVDSNMTDEQVNKVINEGTANKVFQKVILEGSGTVSDTYRDVVDTHKVSFFSGYLLP